MALHGNHPDEGRNEIPDSVAARLVTCSDCGHVYGLEADQISSTCAACGNVSYGDGAKAPAVTLGMSALSEEIVARRVLPRLDRDPPVDRLAAFRLTADGLAVEEVRMTYQVEWQLWAALVRRFENPVHHMAYLTSALAEDYLAQAGARYREHMAVMARLEDSAWQAEVAEVMLARIETLALSRVEARPAGGRFFEKAALFGLLPSDSRVAKVFWVAAGIMLAARFIHLI